MQRRGASAMTDEEVRAFLAEERTLIVASLNRDGTSHLAAIWYALVEGRVAFWTYATSQKARNLGRDPRITCLVEAGARYEELRGVQLRRRAEVTDARAAIQRVGEAVAERYTGPLDDRARRRVAVAGAKRIAITVRPDAVISWDHRKLGDAD